MKHVFIVFLLWVCIANISIAQSTIGTITYNDDKAYEGFNLLYAHNQSNVYLIDNCGDVVHKWEDDDDFRPGNVAYLQKNGNLVKTKRPKASINDPIWAGGGGATVEILDWNNTLLSKFTLNNDTARLHHDVTMTPEGTVLMIAWELKTKEESILAGRDTSLLIGDKLWPDFILEWNPSSNEIIWEWHAWDHLIQDFDPTKENFGVVKDHPELIDINYDEHAGHQDWLHANSIDYNSTLDHILISVPYFNEVWIVDHSTTSVEAASHRGGNSGKGGDLLYRWGNPASYRKGGIEEKQLFFQHSIKWVDGNSSLNDSSFGQISLYNNRVNPEFATLNILDTHFDITNNSYPSEDGLFGPDLFHTSIVHPDTIIIAASNALSSLQILPNGNMLALAGRWGYAYEITQDNEVVWEYRVPIISGQRGIQGTALEINNNITFRLDRYGVDFPGFEGRDLVSNRYRLELNPTTEICDIISAAPEFEREKVSFEILGNPSSDFIVAKTIDIHSAKLISSNGLVVKNIIITGPKTQIQISHLNKGIYYLRTNTGGVYKFIKI